MNRAELLAALERLGEPKVLVVGDLILDRYLFGKVERISPEAPVPVLEFERDEYVPGGAANVAHNLSVMGARPTLAGAVGQDEYGRMFKELMLLHDVGVEGVVEDESRPTTVKTRIIGGHQQIVRVDLEGRHELAGPPLEALRGHLAAALPGVDAVVVSDYAKGVLSGPVLDLLRELTADRRLPVVVDPKQQHFAAYRGFTVVTPNLLEAGQGAGFKIVDRAGLDLAGGRLLEVLQCQAVLVTRGSDGMSLFRPGAPVLDVPTRAREVYDVTGAGDTVVSMLVLALASGLDLPAAAHLANWAAGVKVSKRGTSTVSRDELRSYLERYSE